MNKNYRTFWIISLIISSVSILTIQYTRENEISHKGIANIQLSYSYEVSNQGPINCTSLSIQLALLKNWTPVQAVKNIQIVTDPDDEFTDSDDNIFLIYDFDSFPINKSVRLEFHANISLNILDFSGIDLNFKDDDINPDLYHRYTSYHPLADSTDVLIKQKAQELASTDDFKTNMFNLYNFTSSYLNYKIMATRRGASFALLNGYGDCDEYSALFIGLARSRGVPSTEFSGWYGDFESGFESNDEGALAHAYPMFFTEENGWIPLDPTRGNKNLYDNWLRSDEKRITLTKGIDKPYRHLRYKWIPTESGESPLMFSNYTIKIHNMDVKYSSSLRKILMISIPIIPCFFIGLMINDGKIQRKRIIKEINQIFTP